jgi:MFS family permease
VKIAYGGHDAQMAGVETTRTSGVWAHGRRPLTTGLVFTITLVGFEALAIATVMPKVKDDLGGIDLYGWVFSAFFLGNLVGIVWSGRSADHVGPVRAFIVGLALFGGGLAAGGLAPGIGWLVAARAAQGLGAGAIVAMAYVAIGRGYPTALQPRMFAIISTAWVLPALLGPGLSGVIADHLGWRWVFLGLLPLVGLAAATSIGALRRLGPPGGEAPVDRRIDALLVALGAALVLIAAGSRSLVIAPPLAIIGFVIGGRAFVRIMPPGTLRLAPGLPSAVALRGIATFAFFGTDAYVSLTLTSVHGTSTSMAGLPLTAAALTWTVGAWTQERFVMRVGPRTFVRVGLLVIACGIGLMIVVARADVSVAVAVVAWAVGGLGMGLSYAPVSLVVLGEAPADNVGSATASLQLNDTLGVALGTGTTGAIVAAGAALGWTDGATLSLAFLVCIAFALFGAVAATRLPARVAQ